MNFLIYVEHAAENLQFFLWLRDYASRFAQLPQTEQALAPEWSAESIEAEVQACQVSHGPKQQTSAETAELFKGTDFAQANVHIVGVKSPNFAQPNVLTPEAKGNPFSDPPRTSVGDWSDRDSTIKASNEQWHHKQAAGAFEAADLKWQPCKSMVRYIF